MTTVAEEIAAIGHNVQRPELREEVVQTLTAFETELQGRLSDAENCVITDDDSAGNATSLAKIFSDIIAAADGRRVEIKRPYLLATTYIDNSFKVVIERAQTARAKVIAQLDRWRREKQRIADAAAERLRNEAKAAADKAQREITKGNDARASDLLQTAKDKTDEARVTEAAPTTVRDEYGTQAYGRRIWVTTIVDADKAWRHLRTNTTVLAAMQKVCDHLVRGGARSIPGCTVEEQTKTAIR